jgi:hypothetical protein
LISERDEIISTFSLEELWMFHSIGGRLPYGLPNRRNVVGTLERVLDAMVQRQLKAEGVWRERTRPEQPPNALLDVKVA